jgi:hypothetical protein
MYDLIDQITGLEDRERKKVFSWVASLPQEKIIEIFQHSVKISFQIRHERPELAGKIGKFCAFILAARKAGWDTLAGKGYLVAGKNQFEDFSNLRKARAAAFVRRPGRTTLRKKILAYVGEIKQLKEDGLGFRPIADYLHKCRKVDISATYLRILWNEIMSDA